MTADYQKSATTQTDYQAATQVHVEYLKPGRHIVILPIDDRLMSLIGSVVFHWGAFENLFNQVIEALLTASGREEEGWSHRSFRGRKLLFKSLVAQLVKPRDPEAAKAMVKCAGAAADLHWRRNVVAHGTYRFDRPTETSGLVFSASGVHKGRDVTIKIDDQTLLKLRYDIAHLMGDFTIAVSPAVELSGQLPTWPDTHVLQAYEASSRPYSAK